MRHRAPARVYVDFFSEGMMHVLWVLEQLGGGGGWRTWGPSPTPRVRSLGLAGRSWSVCVCVKNSSEGMMHVLRVLE